MRIEKEQTLIVCLEHRGYLGDHHFFTNEEYWFPGLENRYLGTSGVPFGNFQGTSNYIIEVSGTPMSVSLQLDLASGADDQTPAISYCSAIPSCSRSSSCARPQPASSTPTTPRISPPTSGC